MLRILFVDDETRILDGIRRSLYAMRDTWQMRFVDSGAAAIAAMEEQPADVIVSDMRMPGMDGAQLLFQIMRRYPETVRIILSGHAEQDLIVEASRAAHQFVSKPCDAATLRAAIARTQRLRSILSGSQLAAIVGRVDTLPSPRRAYQALLDCLQDPAARLDSLIEIIGHDVAMTAKLVKLANSGFFGGHEPVQTVERAVELVGIDAISALVMGHHLFASELSITLPGFSIEHLERHSFETAAWARAVALHEGLATALADAAFLAGILHDVGRLVFATRAGADRMRDGGAEELRALMEAHHAEVGGYLLGLWGFTDAIVEAVAWHHAPSLSGTDGLGLSGLVHIADQLAHEHGPAMDARPSHALEPGYLEARNLEDRWPAWRQLRSPRTTAESR